MWEDEPGGNGVAQAVQAGIERRGRKLPWDPTKRDEIIRKPATSIEEVSAEAAERFGAPGDDFENRRFPSDEEVVAGKVGFFDVTDSRD